MSKHRPLPDFVRVRATPEEIAEWRNSDARLAPTRIAEKRTPGVYRVQCLDCEARIWGSGLGIGSHRRSCRPVRVERQVTASEVQFTDEIMCDGERMKVTSAHVGGTRVYVRGVVNRVLTHLSVRAEAKTMVLDPDAVVTVYRITTKEKKS